MNKQQLTKLLLPLIIVLVALGSFSYIYQAENNETIRGETQFNLSYRFFLKNEGPLNLSSLSLRLAALKSWAPYQQLNNIKIGLQPNRTSTDEYNNSFIWYEYNQFNVGQQLDIVISANLTVKFMDYTSLKNQNVQYDPESKLYKLYTAFDPLADPTDPRILQVARSFPDGNVFAKAFDAYNFSSTYIRYKLLSVVKGASFAISNGYGDCDEYQTLFIALARSMGIPAIGHTAWFADFYPGYVSTDAGAIAHAFPMFWVPNVGLISADPTRGNKNLFDNWMKNDNKRITMTQGPNHPYRLLNYRWIPVEGIDNPIVFSNYTITINDMQTTYFSKIRAVILYTLVAVPIIFAGYNLVIGWKIRKEKQHKLEILLDPHY